MLDFQTTIICLRVRFQSGLTLIVLVLGFTITQLKRRAENQNKLNLEIDNPQQLQRYSQLVLQPMMIKTQSFFKNSPSQN